MTNAPAFSPPAPAQARLTWVDAAKGLCIIMVVMMHATLGVEAAMGERGWLGYFVAFARPFRMPDFFLISGLFLALVIDRPWMRYVDRKVVHFAYFYVLWLTIQFVFKAPGMAMEEGALYPLWAYLAAFVEPYGTLWFIYILPVFFIFTRLVRSLPVWFVLVWAAVLEILPVRTGSLLFDEFAARYVWFFIGYAFAARVFDLAEWGRTNPGKALALIALWVPVNAFFVFTPVPDYLVPFLQASVGDPGPIGVMSELPLVSFALGMAGIAVVVWVAALVTDRRAFGWLNWVGAHSLVVYLAFFLPMATARAVLLRLGIISDVGTVSALVTFAAVAGPVVLYGLVRWSGRGRFLFERPQWARIDRPAPAGEPRPALAG